jgi:hypothetical protein
MISRLCRSPESPPNALMFVVNPLQCRNLVQQSAVGRCSFDVAEALQSDPVVEGHHHQPPRARWLPSYSGRPDVPNM